MIGLGMSTATACDTVCETWSRGKLKKCILWLFVPVSLAFFWNFYDCSLVLLIIIF